MIVPSFYPAFRCRAAACRHSCCRGWEIGIDADTAQRYLSFPGPLGHELRETILQDEDGASFRLTAADACPFLRADGLCRLILTQGEGFLCEICREHPRFYGQVVETELAGLGLS